MRHQVTMAAMAGLAALTACGGADSKAGPFSVSAIEQQCVASENDWVEVYAQSGMDAPKYRQQADRVIADCCPKMAAAARSLNTEQREYLWTDLASQLGATLPQEDVEAHIDRAEEMSTSMSSAERQKALAPRMDVFAACKRAIEG